MRKATFNRLKREVGEDLAKIIQTRGEAATSPGRIYLDRQIDKYLRPKKGVFDFFLRDITKLHDLFVEKGDNLPVWSHEGLQWGPSFSFFFAFGYSPIGGGNGKTIRIEPKAALLTDRVAAGVLLHEATHFALSTVDHAYDNCAWPTHDRLKELPDEKCYENADNWRIFYQKMRDFYRK